MAAAAPPPARESEQDALRALTFQRLHPRTYLERFLAEGVRPDGREPGAWRDVSVIVGASRVLRSCPPRSVWC